MATYGLVVVHDGLASTDAQEAALVAAGVGRALTATPLAHEEWQALGATVLVDLTAGDVLVVGALHHLGLTVVAAIELVVELADRGVAVIALANDLDTRDPGVLPTLRVIAAAHQDGRRAQAVALLSGASGLVTTPPKGVFVPERFIAELTED